MGIDALVYLSVLLGAALLAQAFTLLPPLVAYAILGGWAAYVVAAILVLKKVGLAYPLVLILAVLTLLVTLLAFRTPMGPSLVGTTVQQYTE